MTSINRVAAPLGGDTATRRVVAQRAASLLARLLSHHTHTLAITLLNGVTDAHAPMLLMAWQLLCCTLAQVHTQQTYMPTVLLFSDASVRLPPSLVAHARAHARGEPALGDQWLWWSQSSNGGMQQTVSAAHQNNGRVPYSVHLYR